MRTRNKWECNGGGATEAESGGVRMESAPPITGGNARESTEQLT